MSHGSKGINPTRQGHHEPTTQQTRIEDKNCRVGIIKIMD